MDLNRILESLASSGVLAGAGAGGAALNDTLLDKRARKRPGTMLKAGGLAAIGGLAWKVYRNHQNSRHAALRLPEVSSETQTRLEDGSHGLLLVRAMIAAAKADGHIDAAEEARICRRVEALSLRDQEKRLILDELRNPASLETLALAAREPAVRAQVYAASLLAVNADGPAGRVYLQDLAEILALPPTLVRDLHGQAQLQHGGEGSDRAA